MAKPNEKLAESLAELEKLQAEGRRVFKSSELSRVHLERLLNSGFLIRVRKGWVISSSPAAPPGDTTPWFASFWELCSTYCEDRWGTEWHLSPEQSLLLHAENTIIPQQVIVYSPKAANNTTSLLFETSFYDLKEPVLPDRSRLMERDGLRLYTVAAAIVKVPESFYKAHSVDAQVALASVTESSELLRALLDGEHSVIAGRLAGAFRAVGRDEIADEILAAMSSAGYKVSETNPFDENSLAPVPAIIRPAIASRIEVLWNTSRDAVLEHFPEPPATPVDKEAYLKQVEEVYQSDAYHSLSIEGYQVSADLIQRVSSGDWKPEEHDSDRESRDALAARGYYQAFLLVRDSVAKIIDGENPGAVVRTAHRDWYRELFQPCVAAGLIPATALAGYRNDFVFLRTSRYVPPRAEAARDAIPVLFDLIESEAEPAVRAVLGHWLFGYIHPYSDGNGRMARFLMNTMLASGGYPWLVVKVEDRKAYLQALEAASVDRNLVDFTKFLAASLNSGAA